MNKDYVTFPFKEAELFRNAPGYVHVKWNDIGETIGFLRSDIFDFDTWKDDVWKVYKNRLVIKSCDYKLLKSKIISHL